MDSFINNLTDHDVAKKVAQLLMRELEGFSGKSAVLEKLKAEHPSIYNNLISECKTHGLSLKPSIGNFARDAKKVPPSERIAAARKSLDIFATWPKEIFAKKSPIGWLLAGAAAVMGLGAYAINRYGSEHKTGSSIEKNKTDEERAEDIAYTINHSLYCTATDFLNPPINAATDNWLRWLIPGCGHDHSHDGDHAHAHDHAHHHELSSKTRWEKVKGAFKHSFSKQRLIEYTKGEFIGDFGAVPLTIAMQRIFPNFMHGLRMLCEPIIKPFFAYGVESSSKRWAKRECIAVESQVYKDHVRAMYEHEMNHFPQAVVWTGFSLGLNTAYQMYADKSHIPFANKLALKSTSVLSGVLVTAGVVVAARALAPHKMREVDQWTSSHAILPATKAVGKIFGVDEAAVDRMAAHEAELMGESWVDKTENSKSSPSLAV